MRKIIRSNMPISSTAQRCRRTDQLREAEDSPYAPYLRFWLGHRAAVHRELLLNIDAAGRMGRTPVVKGRSALTP